MNGGRGKKKRKKEREEEKGDSGGGEKRGCTRARQIICSNSSLLEQPVGRGRKNKKADKRRTEARKKEGKADVYYLRFSHYMLNIVKEKKKKEQWEGAKLMRGGPASSARAFAD